MNGEKRAEQVLAILQSTPLFRNSSREILSSLVDHIEPVRYAAGETVFNRGEPGACMYILVEGLARAHDGDMVLNLLQPGDVFGEMSALDTEVRSASVTAVEDTLLFSLTQASLYTLMHIHPGVAHGIIQILAQRLRARVRDMAEDFEYMQQFQQVTAAAAAVEAGAYDAHSLDGVARRTDELGQLARVFQRMAQQVYAREQRLIAQVEALRIEIDETRQARQVAEITESEYFQQLKKKAGELRAGRKSMLRKGPHA